MKDNSPEANKKKKKKAQPDDGGLFKDMPIREHLKGDQLYQFPKMKKKGLLTKSLFIYLFILFYLTYFILFIYLFIFIFYYFNKVLKFFAGLQVSSYLLHIASGQGTGTVKFI